MQIRSKALIGICCLLVVIGALFSSGLIGSCKKCGSYFKWFTGDQQVTVVQVTTGKLSVVPFEFRVDSRVSKVSLTIGDELLKEKGISFEEPVIPTKNGVVFSKVIFNLPLEGRVRPGRYHLTVIARDAVTGRIVKEIDIPFALDMLELIWRCSC
jgi:hypothetical protein